MYLDLRKQGIRINAVKYEDIVAYPLESTRAILKYCNLPENLASKATKALEKDSQRNSSLCMKNFNKTLTNEHVLKGSDKVATDTICDLMGLPRVPEPCTLEGTITGTTTNTLG